MNKIRNSAGRAVRSYILLLIFFSSCVLGSEKYTLDPNHSYVNWHASHFGFSSPSGKWLANGSLILDKEKPENSKITVTIKMADLVTGIPEFDKHLKDKMFLNVKKFPTATFESNKVEVIDKNNARVQGILMLHGISKPVTLHVKLNKMGVSPITEKMTAGFTADTSIKRSDFDINALLPGVGDEVKINIEAEAYKE